MADGYAQKSGRPGVASVHTAAGLGNAMASIITAWRNQTPLVVTAGQQTRAMLPTEPYLASPQSTLLPQPYVKWAIEPARAADVPGAMARALLAATTPPCGPTFVSIPEDDWDGDPAPVPTHTVVPALGAAPDAIAHFAETRLLQQPPPSSLGRRSTATMRGGTPSHSPSDSAPRSMRRHGHHGAASLNAINCFRVFLPRAAKKLSAN
nr:hypothetical protein [Actinomycetes bacterium]